MDRLINARPITMHTRLAGRFRMEVFSPGGILKRATPWIPNLLLNSGLNAYGAGTPIPGNWRCHVGTSSAAPDVTQTSLAARIGESGNPTNLTQGASGDPDYYIWVRNNYQFAAGVAAGNLAEIGIGPAGGSNLLSRALILDELGAPTTLTVLSEEVLNVIYELRMYIPQTDAGGTIVLDGVSTDWDARAALASTFVTSTSSFGWGFVRGARGTIAMRGLASNTLPSLTDNPATTGITGTWSIGSYTAGSFKISASHAWSISQGNIDGGIGLLRICLGIGSWHMVFDPPIAKNNTKVLSLTFEHSWGRA